MKKFFEICYSYIDSKCIIWLERFWGLSIAICLLGILILIYYNTYLLSNITYLTGITFFQLGLLIGILPCEFCLIIGKWKKNN